MMNIRIANFPPGTTVDEVREFLGASDDIEDILILDAGDSDDVIAMVNYALKNNAKILGPGSLGSHRPGGRCTARRRGRCADSLRGRRPPLRRLRALQ